MGESNHGRRSEDITEPQTIDELVRATYRDVKELRNTVPQLCTRMTVVETIVNVLAWVGGIGFTALGAVSAWMLLFKKGTQ